MSVGSSIRPGDRELTKVVTGTADGSAHGAHQDLSKHQCQLLLYPIDIPQLIRGQQPRCPAPDELNWGKGSTNIKLGVPLRALAEGALRLRRHAGGGRESASE